MTDPAGSASPGSRPSTDPDGARTDPPRPAPGTPLTRRRRVTGGRSHVPQVRFSDAEFEVVQQNADAAGLTVSGYLALAAEPRGPLGVAQMPVAERRAWASELMAVRLLAANIANNLNQLARSANSGAAVDPIQAAAVLTACRRVIGRAESVLGQLQAGKP